MTARLSRGVSALAAAVMLVAACGDDGPAELTIEGAWARPTPSGATNGVVYFTITPDTDDTIVGVSVPAGIAASATLHTTSTGGDDGGGHHGGGTDEEITMDATDSVEISAGDAFEFSPGGNHVMLEGIVDPLTVGDHFTLTLQLGSGRAPTVDVIVSENPLES